MGEVDALRQKTEELIHELKKEGLWLKQEPEWVKAYDGTMMAAGLDFFQWLQFVYLPNRLMNNEGMTLESKSFITLQVKKYASYNTINENLLRLLIELDSL